MAGYSPKADDHAMTHPSEPPLLELRNISKRFPGVCALHNVNMILHQGETLAVIGENGAGKSTLMKILAGVQRPDDGEVFLDAQPVTIDSVRTATALGIALIHQELNLADNLDVGANIFLGREPRRFGLINHSEIYRQSLKVLGQVGLAVSPRTIVSTLALGYQQMVEITKALSANARILIMDEPTSSLTRHEAEHLFKVIKDLKQLGVSIVYISHRLGEVEQLADRVVVLRDGENAGNLGRDQINHDAMVNLMVGRDVSQFYARRSHHVGDPMLQVENLVSPANPQHKLSFTVHRGEMVGLAGLVGAGRTELLRVLFGIDPAPDNTIWIGDQPVRLHSPSDAIAAGIALVPEDRKRQGAIIEMTVRHNISLAELHHRKLVGGLLNLAAERVTTTEMIRKLNIRTPSAEQVVQYLSGGNQQKVVLAKWLSLRPRILLMDEPTRGIDVAAKQEIYQLMEELAKQGVAILFVSNEMEEILDMSDRALVMHEGCITGQLAHDELTEEAVMHLATGRTQAA